MDTTNADIDDIAEREAVQEEIERATNSQLRYALSMINWFESTPRADIRRYVTKSLPLGLEELPSCDWRDFRLRHVRKAQWEVEENAEINEALNILASSGSPAKIDDALNTLASPPRAVNGPRHIWPRAPKSVRFAPILMEETISTRESGTTQGSSTQLGENSTKNSSRPAKEKEKRKEKRRKLKLQLEQKRTDETTSELLPRFSVERRPEAAVNPVIEIEEDGAEESADENTERRVECAKRNLSQMLVANIMHQIATAR
ncbi:hypothetical protein NA57DRAFT_82089 [Rhizodiscina lignyota]|uniref:Uncharacterized protein n=1 Tax=Rhizodiscina lignyota TaxID=1504668 RepID=A0A9P4LZL7_9PEZI|nr:hypothetical protein NA57DRAFT_82089 [Rhizodiscina lignyota]